MLFLATVLYVCMDIIIYTAVCKRAGCLYGYTLIYIATVHNCVGYSLILATVLNVCTVWLPYVPFRGQLENKLCVYTDILYCLYVCSLLLYSNSVKVCMDI